MYDAIWRFLSGQGFAPHGICLLWQPEMIWAFVISDAAIALAYFSIPAVLITFAVRRPNLQGVTILYMFGAFIVSCGITHIMDIWTMWVPNYGLQVITKILCAVISVGTAVALWPLLPRALAIPSRADLEREVAEQTAELKALNSQLQREIEVRKSVEAALIDARAAALESSAAKSRFLSTMSHELRTPLNAIIGFSQLLAFDPRDPLSERQRGYADNIVKSGHHLLSLIEDILDLSRIEADKLRTSIEDVAAVPLVTDLVGAMRPLAEAAKISLTLDIDDQVDDRVMADRVRLKQILFNLVSNAIKYNRAGGRIRVGVSSTGGELRIAVQDTGQGIAPDNIPKLFIPFNRLGREASSIPGTGIGLSIARRLAEMMSGTIEVASTLGVGSTFTFRMPLLTSQDRERPAISGPAFVPRTPQAAGMEAGTLLYVEDNPDALSLMQELMGLFPDFRMISATSGEAGLKLALSIRPQLILLDLDLPDIDGIEVARRMRADRSLAQSRIVGITAADDQYLFHDEPLAVFETVIRKPAPLSRLVALLEQLSPTTPSLLST